MAKALTAEPVTGKTIDHSDRDHAVFAPSKMKMMMSCLQSVVTPPDAIPEPPSIYALEGIEAHEWLDKSHVGGLKALKALEKKNPEMYEHVSNLHLLIQRVIDKIGKTNIVEVLYEQRVKYSEHIWGTLDVAILYVRKSKLCAYVLDFKYGRGVAVAAEESEQLLTYLVAFIKSKNLNVHKATIAIYQPRNRDNCDTPLDQWEVDATGIKEFEKKLKSFEKKALRVLNGKLKPTETPGDHCRFCPRKTICHSFINKASADGLLLLKNAPALLPTDFHQLPVKKRKLNLPEPIELTDTQLSAVAYAAPLLANYVKSCQKIIYARYFTPNKLKDWKLVEGRPSRELIKDRKAVTEHLMKLGVNPVKEVFKGIGELEEELKAGKNREFLAPIVTYTTPKPKLVPVTDKRPALANTALEMLTEIDWDEET